MCSIILTLLLLSSTPSKSFKSSLRGPSLLDASQEYPIALASDSPSEHPLAEHPLTIFSNQSHREESQDFHQTIRPSSFEIITLHAPASDLRRIASNPPYQNFHLRNRNEPQRSLVTRNYMRASASGNIVFDEDPSQGPLAATPIREPVSPHEGSWCRDRYGTAEQARYRRRTCAACLPYVSAGSAFANPPGREYLVRLNYSSSDETGGWTGPQKVVVDVENETTMTEVS